MHAETITKPMLQSHTKLGLRKTNRHNCHMTIEDELLKALLALEAAVTSVSKDSKTDLMAHFNHIDKLTAQLPKNTDKELLHYLHKKSYEKARMFLAGNNDEIQKGGCLS